MMLEVKAEEIIYHKNYYLSETLLIYSRTQIFRFRKSDHISNL